MENCFLQLEGKIMSKKFYEILNIETSATKDEIRAAYIRLAQKYHPDQNKDIDATERFKEIATAYNVLKDPITRTEYDRGFKPIKSVQDLFNRSAAGKNLREILTPAAPKIPKQGADIICTSQVSNEVLKDGGIIDVTYELSNGDKHTVNLNIPPKAERNGAGMVRITGAGNKGKNAAPNGSLIIVLQAQKVIKS